MCSIFLTNKPVPEYLSSFDLLNARGPDHFSRVTVSNFTFIHTLLSLTGEHIVQPHIHNDIACMFNGELYSFHQGQSSDECSALSECYQTLGENFVKELEGEFAIAVTDFKKQATYFCTDVFGTKPLFYSCQNNYFALASYKEPILEMGFDSINRCKPNTLYKFSHQTARVEIVGSLYEFSLKQDVHSYDNWSESFLSAVDKRFSNTPYDIVLPLSSGHDSGAIACAMELLNVKSIQYSYIGDEHRIVLKERQARANLISYEYPETHLSEQDRALVKERLKKKFASFSYGKDLDEKSHIKQGYEDSGAQGLTFLLDFVKRKHEKLKILASGQGGDEIMGNLSFYRFGDNAQNPSIFPDNLKNIFPWNNFYYGAQSSYLMREEVVTGGLGIEGRYPLLDKQVVQAFLNLAPELKNKCYKAPIDNFLTEHCYPYVVGNGEQIKRGFSV